MAMDMPRTPPSGRPARKPGRDVAGAPRAEMPPPAHEKVQRRALLVGPDQPTLRLCRDVLESSGFAVDQVDSGIGAVVAAREGRPDVILIDIQLRDVRGREAIGWLRSNASLRATPIIALIAKADADAMRDGFTVPLRKPLSASTVQRAIQEVFK
jgi:two-component system cell cycle response regulator DivK